MTSGNVHSTAHWVLATVCLSLFLAFNYGANPSANTCLSENTLLQRLEFASLGQAQKVLALPDAWVRQLSVFDRGARMRTLVPTTTQQFLLFASGAAVEWTPADVLDWTEIGERLSRATQGLNVKLPRVLPVKTDGSEESDAAYTRGRSIMLPERFASLPLINRRRAFFLLAHELFHVLSRANPAQRDGLYSLLGFERVAGFDYPAELEDRRLSNPDTFAYEYAVTVQTTSGTAAVVVPIVQAAAPLEDVVQLPSIFEALSIVLLSVDADTGEVLRDASGNVISYTFGNTDWPARLRRNSAFIIHPEEILADDFATLMEKRADGALPPANPSGFPANDPDLLLDIEHMLTMGCHGR